MKFHQCSIPAAARYWYEASSSEDLTSHVARVSGGLLLLVVSSRDPVEVGKPLRRHISVMVGQRTGLHAREATDEECKAARALWPTIDFEEDNTCRPPGSLSRNFWEQPSTVRINYDIKRTVGDQVDYYLGCETWVPELAYAFGYPERKMAEELIPKLERSDRINGRPKATYEIVESEDVG